jgi:hypothetical protein
MRNVVLAEQQEEKIIKNPRGDVSMRRKGREVRWRVENPHMKFITFF